MQLVSRQSVQRRVARSIRRFLARALLITSLLLFCGVLAVWVRSYWRVDLFGYEGPLALETPQWGGNSSSASGAAEFELWRRIDPAAIVTAQPAFEHSVHAVYRGHSDARDAYIKSLGGFRLLGFGYARREIDSGQMQPGGEPRGRNPGAPSVPSMTQVVWNVTVPYWLPAALFAGAPACWLLRFPRRRRARRAVAGLCVACGYDLRASAGCCPECGRASTSNPKSAA